MSEDITEKKVNLFFKILLSLNVPRIGHPYNRKYIDGYIDELIPVYNLFAEKDVIDNYPSQEKIENWKRKINNELIKLKQDYSSGTILIKEQDSTKARIKVLENKLSYLLNLSGNKKIFEKKNTELYRINLFKDLQKKLGITEEYDTYGLRRLNRRKDELKKNIQKSLEELYEFLDDDKKEEVKL